VEVLDPLNPGDAFVECIVRNKSTKAVNVPTAYSGGYRSDLVLYASGRHDLSLIWWAGSQKPEKKALAGGAEMTVFKAALKDVLLLDTVKPKALIPKEERFYWSWSA
jgi:hypothetical protein